MLKEVLVRLSVIAFVCCLTVTAHAMADQKSHVNVPAGDLSAGLELLARQSGAEFVYSADQLKGLRTHGVAGDLSAKDAVTKLLEGTTLQVRMDATGAMLIALPTASATPQASPAPGDNTTQEGKSKSSGNFLLAQVDQGQTSSPSTVEREGEQPSKKKAEQLEEVIVTGSRIPTIAGQGSQEVKVYTAEQIEKSGQTTVADFLSTLPDVSIATTELGLASGAPTTVRLHGLPTGATLVLLNGRRLEVSGSTQTGGASGSGYFDLNNIPVSAIDRIEVVSEGSSAVYGSDAIGGVVNIILKRDFQGVEANVKQGWDSGSSETDADFAWGQRWDKGALSLLGSYMTRTELDASERSLTAGSDFTRFGGSDTRVYTCNPGNVYSANGVTPLPGLGQATYAAVPAGFTGTPSIGEFTKTAGNLNLCNSVFANLSLIPKSDRANLLLQGSYSLTSAVETFTELMFSHVRQTTYNSPPSLYGEPGYQAYTVSAANPYNPFGQTVGISYSLAGLPRDSQPFDTDFYRALVGARGSLSDSWNWEVGLWDSQDRTDLDIWDINDTVVQDALNSPNPTTALNPFVAGPGGSSSLLQSFQYVQLYKYSSQTLGADAVIHGTLLQLPAGPIQVAAGGEYYRDKLYEDDVNIVGEAPNTITNLHRDTYALFAELRIPIIGASDSSGGTSTLAATLAGRHDHSSDFGSANTPQVGLEWRPLSSLLVRAAYSKAFVAPPLYDLYSPVFVTPNTPVLDPTRGNQQVFVTEVAGGNPNLRPETGQSRSIGAVYSSRSVTNLQVSVTYWAVQEGASIQTLPAQTIVDNESIFPSNVVRNSAGIITQVDDAFVNFGTIDIDGFDYQLSYKYQTKFGDLVPTLAATQTMRYVSALTPSSPQIDGAGKAIDFGSWSPRWKGTAAFAWSLAQYSATITGRYIGAYQDYDRTVDIGNVWYCDANFRYSVGSALASSHAMAEGLYVEAGAVNLFNRLPQYSNYLFGLVGYDPAEADIRGRFIYARVGIKW
jgi:iron complex outermembrane receptor protein